MGGIVALAYGAVAYAVFLLTFLYSIGFVGNMVVPLSVDAGGASAPLWTALTINAALLAVFAVQHSVMARPGFKKAWTKIVPESVERSTYVLLSSGALILLFWQWRPVTGEVWTVTSSGGRAALAGLFWAGWALVLASTFVIDHFDLCGLRQVWLRFRDKEYTDIQFVVRFFYKYIRHPLMLGFVIAFWAAPDMSVGHLFFAGMTTVYMLVAIQLEERDLIAALGEDYARYRKATPMLIPFVGGGGTPIEEVTGPE